MPAPEGEAECGVAVAEGEVEVLPRRQPDYPGDEFADREYGTVRVRAKVMRGQSGAYGGTGDGRAVRFARDGQAVREGRGGRGGRRSLAAGGAAGQSAVRRGGAMTDSLVRVAGD